MLLKYYGMLCKRITICLLFLFFLFGAFAQSGSELQLAGEYYKNGEKEKALEMYKEAYKKDPQIYVYRAYFDVLLEMQEYAEAEKLAKKQAKQELSRSFCFIDLGRLYGLKGDKKQSEKFFQNVIDDIKFGENPASLGEKARYFYEKAASFQKATEVYLKARELSQNPRLYALELAQLYRMQNKIAEMTDEYISAVESDPDLKVAVQQALQAFLSTQNDKKSLESLKKQLYLKAQKQGTGTLIQDLLIWVLLQEQDFDMAFTQAQAYMKRFNDHGSKVYEVARTAFENKAFAHAEKMFLFLAERSDLPQIVQQSRMDLLDLYFEQLKSGFAKDKAKAEALKQAYKNIRAEFPQDPATLRLNRNLAQIYAYYTNEPDSAVQLLENSIAMYGISGRTKAELKMDLADIFLYMGHVWDATLLYSQIEKDFKQDPVGFAAKLKNAQLSYYIADFEWAKSQLDVLKAATSKQIANDAMELSLLIKEHNNADSTYLGLSYVARADCMLYRHLPQEAMNLLDTVLMLPGEEALYDEVYFRKASVYLSLDSVEAALTQYVKLIDECTESLLRDDALMAAAQLLEQFPEDAAKKKQALEYYETLFMDYSGSNLALKARDAYRKLRASANDGASSKP